MKITYNYNIFVYHSFFFFFILIFAVCLKEPLEICKTQDKCPLNNHMRIILYMENEIEGNYQAIRDDDQRLLAS